MKRERILARVGREPLHVYFGLCSGSRQRKATCRECVDVCPEGLLNVGEFGLIEEIDLGKCTGCGLCATACPNGVFEVKEPSDIALLRMISSLLSGKEKLTVRCDEGAERERNGGCDLTLPCVGQLNEALLVAAAAMGAKEIVLKTYGCRECEKKTALVLIERSVESCRELLQAFGKTTKIVLSEEGEPAMAPEETEEKEIEETHKRREFLRSLKGGVLAVAGMVTESAIDSLAGMVSRETEQAKHVDLEYRVPSKRRILICFLRKLGKPQLERISGAHLPLAQVCIHENCSLCDCCSQLCPTSALRSTTRGGTKGIEFFPSLCTGCRVCELACLDGALCLSDTIEVAGLLEDGGERLISYPTCQCGTCDETFGAPVPKKYCPYCERKMRLRNVPW